LGLVCPAPFLASARAACMKDSSCRPIVTRRDISPIGLRQISCGLLECGMSWKRELMSH